MCPSTPSGRCALVAHYNGGCVSTLPIGRTADWARWPRLSALRIKCESQRQTHAYAHWIGTDATGRHALVCDLGLDKVFSYRFDAGRPCWRQMIRRLFW